MAMVSTSHRRWNSAFAAGPQRGICGFGARGLNLLPGLQALGSEKVSKKSSKYESDIKTQALALHIALFNFSKTLWLGHVDAFHLRQPGYAGMNIKDVPLAPFRYQFRLRGQAGPRTDKAHISAQDIPQLRKLIQLEPAQNRARSRHRTGGDLVGGALRGALVHGAKLVADECPLILADALLPEQDRAF